MTKLQVKKLIMKNLLYVVHMDLNSFGALVLNYIVCNVDGNFVVAPKSCRLILGKTKLYEEWLNPKKNSTGIDNTLILYLCRRKNDWLLFFAKPSDMTQTKFESVTRSRLSIINITCSI
jgi:hypothetical protein